MLEMCEVSIVWGPMSSSNRLIALQWYNVVCRLQLKCVGTRWRTGRKVNGRRANGLCSQYSSHYLGTWCIQHYCCWCAKIGCQQSTQLTPTGRLKWTRPFRRKTKSNFSACAITFQRSSAKALSLCGCFRIQEIWNFLENVFEPVSPNWQEQLTMQMLCYKIPLQVLSSVTWRTSK